MFDEIFNHVELFEKHKNDILNMWMDNDVVQRTLSKNDLDVSFFKERLASNLFNFLINVIKSENKTSYYPFLSIMRMLFNKKNILLSDIFLIYVNLKNVMIHFLYKNSLLDDKVLAEISMLMDSNFADVVNEYMALFHQNANTEDISNIKPSDNINNILSSKNKSPNLHTSAEKYLQELDYDEELILELDELESDVLCTIDISQLIDNSTLILSSILFDKYSKALHIMFEFEELSYTLKSLKYLLTNTDVENMDEKIKKNIPIYLKAIISDLKNWRKSIFITSSAEDIHYLDKTLLSSIAQLRTSLSQINNTEAEIEFF